jgi:hypothetical protein
MLEVVYDEPYMDTERQVRISPFDAADQMMKMALESRGEDWVRENYDNDKALEDFMTVHWAWLEVDGRKLKSTT